MTALKPPAYTIICYRNLQSYNLKVVVQNLLSLISLFPRSNYADKIRNSVAPQFKRRTQAPLTEFVTQVLIEQQLSWTEKLKIHVQRTVRSPKSVPPTEIYVFLWFSRKEGLPTMAFTFMWKNLLEFWKRE